MIFRGFKGKENDCMQAEDVARRTISKRRFGGLGRRFMVMRRAWDRGGRLEGALDGAEEGRSWSGLGTECLKFWDVGCELRD